MQKSKFQHMDPDCGAVSLHIYQERVETNNVYSWGLRARAGPHSRTRSGSAELPAICVLSSWSEVTSVTPAIVTSVHAYPEHKRENRWMQTESTRKLWDHIGSSHNTSLDCQQGPCRHQSKGEQWRDLRGIMK